MAGLSRHSLSYPEINVLVKQVYVNGEFVGGSDILMGMHKSGELEGLLEDATRR